MILIRNEIAKQTKERLLSRIPKTGIYSKCASDEFVFKNDLSTSIFQSILTKCGMKIRIEGLHDVRALQFIMDNKSSQ